MQKQNPIHLITRFVSLLITGFLLFFFVFEWKLSFFIIGILFFVGLILFVLNIVNKLATNTIENKFEHLKECWNCRSVIPQEAEFCPNCGTDLKDDSNEKVECEYCGHMNKKGTLMCEKCNGLIG